MNRWCEVGGGGGGGEVSVGGRKREEEMVRNRFFFQAEDGIRGLVRSRRLGGVYRRQVPGIAKSVV